MDDKSPNQNLEPIVGQPGWYWDAKTGKTVSEEELGSHLAESFELEDDVEPYEMFDGEDFDQGDYFEDEEVGGQETIRQDNPRRKDGPERNAPEGGGSKPQNEQKISDNSPTQTENPGDQPLDKFKNPTDILNALPTDRMGETGEKIEKAKDLAKDIEDIGELIATEGADLKAWGDLALRHKEDIKKGIQRQIIVAVFAFLLVFGVPVVIVSLAFMGYGTDSAMGQNAGSSTPFDCEAFSYVFPYKNKSVPSIPKTHHDYSAIDLMSADGEPLVIVTDGTIKNPHSTDTGDGGISFTLVGNDGYYYYYAHLSYLDPSIKSGLAVTAGQYAGNSGHTGNASASSPHLHFGISKGEQVKGFYPARIYNPPENPAQVSPWQTLEAWKAGKCITPGT